MKSVWKFPAALLLLVVSLASFAAVAGDYPSRTIRIVVGYAAGGGADLMARIYAEKLGERLGQSVIVENRPGGNGLIGAGIVARAAPDGFTLLLGASSEMVLNPALDQVPFDAVRDFSPVIKLYSNPMVFAAHSSLGVSSIPDLIALAKAKPGKVLYASGAEIFYLTGEMFKQQANVDIVRVPYKGSGEALEDVVSGHVPLLITSLPTAMEQVKVGALRGLAVTSRKRDGLLPELPTMQEVGLKNFDIVSWTGLYAPAGTPPTIIDKLNRELAAINALDDVKARARTLGVTPESSSPEETGASQQVEIARLRTLVSTLHISLK